MAMNSRLIGSGEITLVLSHGYGGSQKVWDEVVPELSKRYQVLLFDWSFSAAVYPPVAFGSNKVFSFEAFADDLISLLDDYNMKGIVFVGHSFSGMVGCCACVKRPDLFRHLVLVAASPRYISSEDYEGGLEPPEVDSILRIIKTDFKGWAERFAPTALGTDDPIPVQKFSKSLKGMDQEAALGLAEMVFLSDQRHLLGRVEVPCTIIQGTNDAFVPVAVGCYMQSRVKGKAAVEIFEKDGHFPQITSPNKFLRVLDRILLPSE